MERAVVAEMITKGAKINDADFPVIVDYLAQSFPPSITASVTAAVVRDVCGGGGGLTMGPNDKQLIDPGQRSARSNPLHRRMRDMPRSEGARLPR